ncbi:V-type ATP synthase subunit I [Haloarchaeobius sp. HME9146]|uniref:V-type ATP synthase subunit I n=1 Tax=Haloarchaeobius sp. HME9146 TaxID=2978732 RepID=UPI0021C160CB|nr:V-type ATP synthase subunit I [Haloarchaeobius sp. HME9146]MCT9094618.1 V-type ATP synthase subunit I [Haloarchaeobius sp. HME9146]
MLRPEQMSKVSVTGSKSVMDDVIETVHDLRLVHLSDYDGSWDGFSNGNPVEGAEDASEKLVTVRSIKSILGVEAEHAGPSRIVTDDALEEELEEVRQEANRLDDRRNELEAEVRELDEKVSSLAPFAELGIPLHLLSGYDSLQVAVGEGDVEAVKAELNGAKAIRSFDVESGGGDLIAVFAYPESNASDSLLDDLLVRANFTRQEIPDGEGDPTEYIDELRHRRQQLESKLTTVEDELEDLRLDAAGFLLAAEERLSIDVQKSEAPLQFATTENAFVAEGWLPTDEVDTLTRELDSAVGDHAEVQEIERADYHEGHAVGSSEMPGESHGTSGGAEAAADGGVVTMGDAPPTVQQNNKAAEPFEFLIEMVNRPKYTELDPTIVLLMTFPLFYGFMLGDLGYGLIYTAVGFLLYTRTNSDVLKALGGIGLWAGGFTMLFGILYGEIFGLHVLGEVLFGGSPPMHKGLQPAYLQYGQTWLVVSMLLGLLHLTVGYVFGFINDLDHGPVTAFIENGSWATMMFGVWMWIFSTQAEGLKPDFLFQSFGGSKAVYDLGFTGFSPAIGTLGLVLFVGGLVAMIYGEVQHMGGFGLLVGALESVNVLVNVLSYLRIGAVILAKAGMAFVVNLLFFGVYVVETEKGAEWHFGTTHDPKHMLEVGTYHGHEVTEVMFGGLLHGGIGMALAGVLILIVGHLVVLLLGVTSAGLQGVRLEYVEFFDKFYEGGGRVFNPFGYERTYTTED